MTASVPRVNNTFEQELLNKALKKTLAKTPSVQQEGWNILNSLGGWWNSTKHYAQKVYDKIGDVNDVIKKGEKAWKQTKDTAAVARKVAETAVGLVIGGAAAIPYLRRANNPAPP